MGILIYVNGEGTISGTIQKEMLNEIRALKDGWNEEAFIMNEQTGAFHFKTEGKEGRDPVNDGIIVPIEGLLKYAGEHDLRVNGEFSVTSDWKEHDNITVLIKESSLRTVDSGIYNATDDELIEELSYRGYDTHSLKKKITSWSDIKKMAMSGTLKDMLKSGDVLPLTLLNGDKVDLVVGFDKSGKAYFIFDKAMSDRHVMNKKWTNKGGYAESEMARYADENVFSMLPTDIQQVIEPTKIVQIWDGECRETWHKLFCLSYTQVFGYDEGVAEQEPQDELIDIFKNPLAKMKRRSDGETVLCVLWWLRSVDVNNSFFYVDHYGFVNNCGAGNSLAVVLGFCIEPNR